MKVVTLALAMALTVPIAAKAAPVVTQTYHRDTQVTQHEEVRRPVLHHRHRVVHHRRPHHVVARTVERRPDGTVSSTTVVRR